MVVGGWKDEAWKTGATTEVEIHCGIYLFQDFNRAYENDVQSLLTPPICLLAGTSVGSLWKQVGL